MGSACDFPSALDYRELVDAFPDAVDDTAELEKRVIAATAISWIVLLAPISIGLSILGWILR